MTTTITTTQPTRRRQPTRRKGGIFGMPVGGIVFWMARNAVSVDEAIQAVQFLGSSIKESTIRSYYAMALRNDFRAAELPHLTEAHIDALSAALPTIQK